MPIRLANYCHIPTHHITTSEPQPALTTSKNKLSIAFSKIKNAFTPKLADQHAAPNQPHHPNHPNHAAPLPLVAQEAPIITLPSPIELLPLNEALNGIDRQLAELNVMRADNIIHQFDQKLTVFYGNTIEDTEENAAHIRNVQTWVKKRNKLAAHRNTIAQGTCTYPMGAIQGPTTERGQKHILELDRAASELNNVMGAVLQKSAGRKPTLEIENNYLNAHKALTENRNAWLTGELDQSSKFGMQLLTLTDHLKPLNVQAQRSTAIQSSQLRKQLELNVASEKHTFDNQHALFDPDDAPILEQWSSAPYYELDSTCPPIPTGAQFKITHTPIADTSNTWQAARIQRHVSKLETEIEQIDKRLERLSNGYSDPLTTEQLQFIRNAISTLRNSWAAGELTQKTLVNKTPTPIKPDLLRKELEHRIAQAKALDSNATPPQAINPTLSGSALDISKGNVKRCDEALAKYDRAIYKASNTGIEGVTLSRNVFEAREAMMQLRNAWANGELVEPPAGAKPQRFSAHERRAELERQVQARSLIKLEAQLPEPPDSDASEAALNRIKFASKTKIIKDINHELVDAYLKIANPAFISQDHGQPAHATVT